MFCREEAAGFAPFLDEVRAVGAEMVFIGNGTVEHAKAFREDFPAAAKVPLFTDPKRASYRAAGLTKRAVKAIVDPRALVRGLKLHLKGTIQRRTMGDPLQLGGVIVVDAKGGEVWRHDSDYAGDAADPHAALDALLGVAGKKKRR